MSKPPSLNNNETEDKTMTIKIEAAREAEREAWIAEKAAWEAWMAAREAAEAALEAEDRE